MSLRRVRDLSAVYLQDNDVVFKMAGLENIFIIKYIINRVAFVYTPEIAML